MNEDHNRPETHWKRPQEYSYGVISVISVIITSYQFFYQYSNIEMQTRATQQRIQIGLLLYFLDAYYMQQQYTLN